MANVTLESVTNSKRDLGNIYKSFLDTKDKLSLKYKEAGSLWDDKTYQDIGKGINECLAILSKNTQTLENTMRVLEIIEKQIIEYQQVKIVNDTRSDFLSSLQGMSNTNVSVSSSVSSSSTFGGTSNFSSSYNPDINRCGDIKVQEGALSMSYDYREMIDNRIENATSKAKQVYKTYAKRVVIQNANYSGTPGYYENDGFDRGIFYNAASDTNGNNFFTYVGEMIDQSGRPNYSSNEAFTDSLINECNNYNGRSMELRSLLRSGNNLNSRAFATFFQASMGNASLLNEIRTNFPNSYNQFNNILDGMIGIERGEICR